MAADRAMGLISRLMLSGTERGTIRQEQIAALIAEASRENVLASLVAASDAAGWAEMEDLDAHHIALTGRGARREFAPRCGDRLAARRSGILRLAHAECGGELRLLVRLLRDRTAGALQNRSPCCGVREDPALARWRRRPKSRASTSRCALVSGGARSTSSWM
jgi:hypothetical protein